MTQLDIENGHSTFRVDGYDECAKCEVYYRTVLKYSWYILFFRIFFFKYKDYTLKTQVYN